MKDSKAAEESYRQEYLRYAVGFLVAILLVYVSYFAVTREWLAPTWLAVLLLASASLQLTIQLRVFLHLGQEKRPKVTMWSMIYVIMMVLILVVCSLWIMGHLNYNMGMTPQQMEKYMLLQNSKGF